MNRTLVLVSAALLVVGCPAPSQPLDAPPDVRYAVDPCDRCQMIVSEERFAAAYVTPAGDTRRFDDLGCLTAFLQERPEDVAQVGRSYTGHFLKDVMARRPHFATRAAE